MLWTWISWICLAADTGRIVQVLSVLPAKGLVMGRSFLIVGSPFSHFLLQELWKPVSWILFLDCLGSFSLPWIGYLLRYLTAGMAGPCKSFSWLVSPVLVALAMTECHSCQKVWYAHNEIDVCTNDGKPDDTLWQEWSEKKKRIKWKVALS